MKRLRLKSIQARIVVFSLICTAIIGIVSNLYLYKYLNNIIVEKSDKIDKLYVDTIENQLSVTFKQARFVFLAAASNQDVTQALAYKASPAPADLRRRITAGNVLTDYLRGSSFDKYVYKLTAFNTDGTIVQASSTRSGLSSDYQQIMNTNFFKDNSLQTIDKFVYTRSITPNGGMCLAMLSPVFDKTIDGSPAYVYIELSPAIITDVLATYSQINPIFAANESGDKIISANTVDKDLISTIDLSAARQSGRFSYNQNIYSLAHRPILNTDVSIYNCSDITALALDSRRMSYTLLVVLASVIIIAFGVLVISSHYITRPLNRLVAHIRKMSENDFSYDPEIEKTADEIGEVGKVINEMCLSFKNLLSETVSVSEQKKNIEIALLQSQVNPHFLYNTLDSIHWMSVIQKNTGISNITRSLSNLLKNMAKGYSQKITLQEELKLLDDYVTIQSIRYMETFELVNNIDEEFYKYNIVKLTLQPIVENAIFHGIEPSGRFGTISLSAVDEGEYILITVEDTGVGMSEVEVDKLLLQTHEDRSGNSMNGIGVVNVNNRLQLVYGSPCGLAYESKKGVFTRVNVRIKKEEASI